MKISASLKGIRDSKKTELVILHNALFMYHYYYNLLPSSFANFFQTVASMHSHNTRLASKSTYYINTIKTNYGKFNIRFAAVKVWNHLDESIKHLPLKTFKNKVKLNILQSYCSWVFNWSLLLLFLFSLSDFLKFIFCPLFFWPIICFARALVPTYILYLNIIYFYSARLAFQLFWVNVTFFCINILCV